MEVKSWYDNTGRSTRRKPRTAAERLQYKNSVGEDWVKPEKAKEPKMSTYALDDSGAINLELLKPYKPFAEKNKVVKRSILAEFPSCCGCAIIHYFGWDSPSTKSRDTISEMHNDIPILISRAVSARKGFILATTNQNQKDAGSILAYYGFIPIAIVNNPNYKELTVITTWMLTLAKNAEIKVSI